MYSRTKKEYMLGIGSISLVLAIFLDRFVVSNMLIDFVCGVFTGLSLTMNLAYLIKFRFEKSQISIKNKR